MMDFHNPDLYNVDCIVGMKAFPDGYFDLAIVDPPYGIGYMTMSYTKSGAIRTHGHSAATRRDYRKQSEWDVKPSKEYFDELFRVSKKQIIWGVITSQTSCRRRDRLLYGIREWSTA